MSPHELHTETIGSGDKALICLHGWGITHHYWSHAKEEMGDKLDHLRLILVDLPGHGESPFPRKETDYSGYTTSQLTALIDQTEASRISILGHSMGSLFALVTAGERPQKISQAILDSSPLFGKSSMRTSRAGELMAMNPLISYPYLYLMKCPLLIKKFFIPLTVYKMEDLNPKDHKILIDGFSRSNRRAIRLANRAIRNFDGTKIIRKLSESEPPTPRLTYIFGEKDKIINTSFTIEKLKKLHLAEDPPKIITFPQTGHCTQMERPAEYYQTIKKIILS